MCGGGKSSSEQKTVTETNDNRQINETVNNIDRSIEDAFNDQRQIDNSIEDAFKDERQIDNSKQSEFGDNTVLGGGDVSVERLDGEVISDTLEALREGQREAAETSRKALETSRRLGERASESIERTAGESLAALEAATGDAIDLAENAQDGAFAFADAQADDALSLVAEVTATAQETTADALGAAFSQTTAGFREQQQETINRALIAMAVVAGVVVIRGAFA